MSHKMQIKLKSPQVFLGLYALLKISFFISFKGNICFVLCVWLTFSLKFNFLVNIFINIRLNLDALMTL